MKLTKFIFLLFAVTLQLTAKETLDLKFNGPQKIKVGKSEVKIDGQFQNDEFLIYGKKGISIPAATLVGKSGTIIFKFKLDKFKEPLLVLRHLLTLRTKSRLRLGFYVSPHKPTLRFWFSDLTNKYYFKTKEPLQFGKVYQAGFTWDGTTVRVYLDGILRAATKQPVAVAAISNLNIGPYRDGWIVPKTWGNDCLAGELRTWDTALLPKEIAKICGIKLKPLIDIRKPILQIPKLVGKALVIDGELNDEAWKYAASMPRLIYGNSKGKSGEIPAHKFLITYDKDNLYIGFDSYFRGGAPFQKGHTRTVNKEGEVWGSESFEFYILVDGRKYRFGGNVAGGYVECLGVNSKWDGKWTYRKSLKMQIDDSKVWQGEVAIPWETLGVKIAPKNFLFNFCRTWTLPGIGKISSLSLFGKSYNDDKNFIKAVLVDNCPVLQVLKQNNPNTGVYRQEIALASLKGGPITYTLELGKIDGSFSPLILFDRTYKLAPKEYFTEKIQKTIDNSDYDCLIYTCKQKNNITMREIVPFKLNKDFCAISPLFLSEKLLVKVKLGMLKRKFGQNFAGKLILTAPGQKEIFRKAVEKENITIAFPRANPSGMYKIVLINQADNKKIYECEINYPGIGEWEKMTFPNIVIPPFTAMKKVTNKNSFTAEMYGRAYKWNKQLFPSQIISQKTKLMSAPIVLEINGKAVIANQFKVGLTTDSRIEFAASARNSNYTVSEQSWIEYDGVLWNQLQIKAKANLKNVKLKIKMPTAVAKYIHGASGRAWGTKTTKKLKMGKSTLAFYPVLWLGMENKGLCFFAESRKGWKSSSQKTFMFNKKKDQTTIEVYLANNIKAGETFKFNFGLLASPVRPLPANYPLNTLSWSHIGALNRPGHTPVSDVILMLRGDWDLGSFFCDQNTRDGKKAAAGITRISAEITKFGGRPIPYTCARYLSVKYPEVAAFKDEWVIIPEIVMDYDNTGHFVYDCCPKTGANAFFVNRFQNMLKIFPKLKGIYFDFGNISECSNKLHGCDQTTPLLAMREFYRRIALVQLQAGIKEPVIVLHNTDCVMLPTLTFSTHLVNGEQVRQASSSLLHNRKDILDSYGIDMFASELGTLPFGITNSVYMPFDKLAVLFGGNEEDTPYKFRMTKAALAGTLPHNTLISLWRNHFGIIDKIVRVYDKFKVPEARFYGYWDQPAIVKSGKDIYVSVYRHKNRNKLLAVIGHVGKEHLDQELEIVFDLKKLGLKKLSKAVDTMTMSDSEYNKLYTMRKKYKVPPYRAPLKLGDFGSEVQSFKNNSLKMKLKHHSFAIIELSK